MYSAENVGKNRTKLLWDHTIFTDHSVNHNKPNLVLLFKEERVCFTTAIAAPLGRSTVEKQQSPELWPLGGRYETNLKIMKDRNSPGRNSSDGISPGKIYTKR